MVGSVIGVGNMLAIYAAPESSMDAPPDVAIPLLSLAILF